MASPARLTRHPDWSYDRANHRTWRRHEVRDSGITMTNDGFIARTIELARANVEAGGRPFSCVIVRDSETIAEGVNLVAQTNDPTAHAEIVAIREACMLLGTENLYDCEIYVLAHPCPMCLGALYYCSPARVLFLTERRDYAQYYSDDRKYFEFAALYDEWCKPWKERRLPMEYHPRAEGIAVYELWHDRTRAEATA